MQLNKDTKPKELFRLPNSTECILFKVNNVFVNIYFVCNT